VQASSSRRLLALLGIVASLAACGGWGNGSKWVQEPINEEERSARTEAEEHEPAPREPSDWAKASNANRRRTIGGAAPDDTGTSFGDARPETPHGAAGGRVLGTFRNTYYDFPNEADHTGPPVSLMNARCEPIARVPRGFYEAVCVQGSGSLARGGTVSFAKRDCTCAEVCPRTGQRICFEALDKARYPWGRGASGAAIAPLRSVAADTNVLPMGTVIYIPELDGVEGVDGCFVVEDRGLRVQGEHVDIFTGEPARTATMNARVPSNAGVTLVVDAPKCAHLSKR
jgi:3D (Asp-Asp-Asp) domain-containing protein